MHSPATQALVMSALIAFAIAAVVASVVLLRRGRLYHRLKPNARPRRWVLIWLLILFATFVIWLPVWAVWPGALISRVLLALFGVTFAVVLLAIRNFSWLIDRFVVRRGWPLR